MSELETFCEILYGDDKGYVYSPTKDPATGAWVQHFFKWPLQKKGLYKHIRALTRSHEVYIGPALFDSRKVSKDTFLSTRSVWTEFDGELPETLKGLPEPTLKIQSSDPGHEHWYWIFDNTIKDGSFIELINKKIAYTLYTSDKSVRDITQVLRPPTTIHHDTGKIVSRIGEIADSSAYISIEDFAHIKEPVVAKVNIDQTTLPDIQWVIALHEWDADTFDLFQKPEVPKYFRSTCLTRLAFSCSEIGMDDTEIAAVLLYKDNHWKKYSNREDQFEKLIGIIRHVRSEKATRDEKDSKDAETAQALGFQDFLRLKIEIKWIIQGVLPVAGQAVLFGEAGCGKTTLALRMGMAVAREQNYLNWITLQKKRVLFVSAEMPHEELTEFFNDMEIKDTSSLQENFFIYPIGHGFPLNHKKNQSTILEMIDKHKIEVIIFDSLSVVAGGSTNDDKTIVSLNEWINKYIRVARKCAVLHIHHSRKPDKLAGGGVASAKSLGDLYGSTFIATNALTVIGMERRKRENGSDLADLYYTKGRYLREDKLTLLCMDNRDFSIAKEVKEKKEVKNETKDTSNGGRSEHLFGEFHVR